MPRDPNDHEFQPQEYCGRLLLIDGEGVFHALRPDMSKVGTFATRAQAVAAIKADRCAERAVQAAEQARQAEGLAALVMAVEEPGCCGEEDVDDPTDVLEDSSDE